MVRITNNINEFEVTNGAYESIFKAQGYTKIEGDTTMDHVPEVEDPGEDEMSEDEKFLSDLIEKPVSQWSKAEVKKYVDLKGINTTGATTLAEVKERIKATIS